MAEASAGQTLMRLSSRSGLRAEINANGSLRRFDCDSICLPLFVGNELDGGPANLYLRRTDAATVEWTALLGPTSPTSFHTDPAGGMLVGSGSWQGINYTLALVLAQSAPSWFWHIHLENTNDAPVTLDLTYAQDVALASYGGIRLNEFYVSQYIDHTPLQLPGHGTGIASRQNQAADGKHPWSLIGSLQEAASFATDALQFHGLAGRGGEPPVGISGVLPGRRLQHEHSMVVLRNAPVKLAARAVARSGFFGVYVPDHPGATSPNDVQVANAALALPEAKSPPLAGIRGEAPHAQTLFSSAPLLKALDLSPEELRDLFGSQWRHVEVDEHGARVSFFHGRDRHVVLRAKELQVLRPHGHLLRTGRNTTPDETALTSTTWMSGVFHSMVTEGHVSINRFLSTVHTYLGLFRSHGQRVFVEDAGGSDAANAVASTLHKPQIAIRPCGDAVGLADRRVAVERDRCGSRKRSS